MFQNHNFLLSFTDVEAMHMIHSASFLFQPALKHGNFFFKVTAEWHNNVQNVHSKFCYYFGHKDVTEILFRFSFYSLALLKKPTALCFVARWLRKELNYKGYPHLKYTRSTNDHCFTESYTPTNALLYTIKY